MKGVGNINYWWWCLHDLYRGIVVVSHMMIEWKKEVHCYGFMTFLAMVTRKRVSQSAWNTVVETWWTDNDLVDTISSLSMNIEKFPSGWSYVLLIFIKTGPRTLLDKAFFPTYFQRFSVFQVPPMHLEVNFFGSFSCIACFFSYSNFSLIGDREKGLYGVLIPADLQVKETLFPKLNSLVHTTLKAAFPHFDNCNFINFPSSTFCFLLFLPNKV